MDYPSKWEKNPWKPKKVIYEATDEPLSASTGLGPLIDAFIEAPEFEAFKACLPKRVSNASYSSEQLVLLVLCGFWYGHDSLDDLEEFEDDPSVEDKLGGLATSKTLANYLRDFTAENIQDLRMYLSKQGFCYRERISGKDCAITFDLDSTFHEQSGKLMEGVKMNRDGKCGLDSLLTIDDKGFAYDMLLRSGNTYSSDDSEKMIIQVMDHIPNRHEIQHYFRADSAFAKEDFLRAALSKSLKGTVTAHGNSKWESHIDEVTEWKPWIYTEKEIKKSMESGKPLPLVDIGILNYEPGWAKEVTYPIVIKRTRLKDEEQTSLFNDIKYKYWGVLSLRGVYPLSAQELLEFHQGRGNMENFIREGKINFDLKHFPCQSLSANHAYGLLALVAHNFLRAMAILMRPDKPHFAKKLRRRLIAIPGRLVRGSGYFRMKMPTKFFQEVMDVLKRWRETFDPVQNFSTG